MVQISVKKNEFLKLGWRNNAESLRRGTHNKEECGMQKSSPVFQRAAVCFEKQS